MSSRAIKIKNIKLKSAADVPNDVSETPGGTMFAFTPGGTKIVYTRDYLMSLKNSPASLTPPKGMTSIPGVTCPVSPLAQDNTKSQQKEQERQQSNDIPEEVEEDEMEM